MIEELALSLNDHEKARKEVAFLLNILSHTIEDVMGKAFRNMGLRAGNEAARKIPLSSDSPDIHTVMEDIIKFYKGGFNIAYEIKEEEIKLTFNRCALKEICRIENIPLGANLCQLFHTFIDGMINELTQEHFRQEIVTTDDPCIIVHKPKAKLYSF